MSENGLLLIIPGSPALSVVVLVVASVVLLYMARRYAHSLILTLARSVHGAMRLAARAVQKASKDLKHRNKEVLLSAGAEHVERQIEREFMRIGAVVERDLQPYPALHRSIADLITVVDEDYRESTETPPSPPEWLDAVRAVSAIPSKDESLVGRMLGEIKQSLDVHHKDSMREYRKQSAQHHALLKRLMPSWRKVSQTLDRMEMTVTGVLHRAEFVDRKVKEYKEILAGTEKAQRMLASSSLTQFFISGIVLLIAIGGAIVNFNLIALPMSEMVGGSSYLGPFQMSQVAALVIILVETVMGVYLMEALRITQLFPIIGLMDDRKRMRFLWAAFIILVIMAGIESSLAFMRDVIVADKQALIQSLTGAEGSVIPETMNWIPTVGQMVMGFILPFALAFVAIPFESFVHSSRTMLGVLAIGLMNFLGFLLRLVGNVTMGLAKVLLAAYDLVAFPLLWVERIVGARTGRKKHATDEANHPSEVTK